MFFATYAKGSNFCDSLFASLEYIFKLNAKWGLLVKEKNTPKGANSFNLENDEPT